MDGESLKFGFPQPRAVTLRKDPKRDRARPAHLSRGPGDTTRIREFKLGKALDELFDGDAQLETRQVRSHTTMDAKPEGSVTIQGTINDKRVGVLETAGSRFAAGKPSRTQSSFFMAQPWNSTSSLTRRAMVTGA